MSMKYVAAFLMAYKSGNSSPSKSDVESILNSVGANVDDDVLTNFMKTCEGKDPEEMMATGMTMMQSVAVAAPTASPVDKVDAPAEEPQKEDPVESDTDSMGSGGMFDIFG